MADQTPTIEGDAGRMIEAQPVFMVNAAGPVSSSNPSDVLAGTPGDVIEITPTVLNADAYDSGDVLFDSAQIAGVFRAAGGRSLLQSLSLIDKDDQGVAMTLVFFRTNVSLGTKDAAPSISDADALKFAHFVDIAASDYKDLGGVRVASLANIGKLFESEPGATDLYVAAITGGAPTHTTGGLVLRFGFLQC